MPSDKSEKKTEFLSLRASKTVKKKLATIAEEQTIAQLIEHRQTAAWYKASRRFSELELAVLADWQKLEIKALTFSINALLI